MNWSQAEIEQLSTILARLQSDLAPLEGKDILVMCSAAGDIAFWLAERMTNGKVTGIELDSELLAQARQSIRSKPLEAIVEFQPSQRERLAFADESFDALVSEFVIFPTPMPTEIGQPEMRRVLKPGGVMVLTDVIVTRPIPSLVRQAFKEIGLEYLCEGTQDDFRHWMAEADMTDVEIIDLTPVVRKAWEQRRSQDELAEQRRGYAYLLENLDYRLGEAIYYIYVRGTKT